ncbi:MAG: 2Fe-2S iron-sulfur cluster binding domain-containing protein, partial [Proteobacteria bacterium]|nr:2Fe-2S iron-sulfur cluster binding domain-containing protein [Pseudomonadota bacterium]
MGTLLLEAAAEAGLLIEAMCGGKGTCGSCLMETGVPGDGTSVANREPHLVYGCREQVQTDLVVTPLETGIGERRRIVTGTSYLLRQTAELATDELHPLCRKVQLEVPPPSIELSQSDGERLVRALKQSEDVEDVGVDLETLRQLPDALRVDGGLVEATFWDEPANHRLLRLGQGEGYRLGVACDLGTSTVVLKLFDLVSGKTLGVASDYNRQVRSGAD